MGCKSVDDIMPWVGLYIAIASFICTLAMAADVVRSLWQWKLWFPNRFFTLNAATITLIAIAMKLPVDLNNKLVAAKYVSIFFLVTMLANFLPSLGLLDGRELLMNIVALAILVITIGVNMGIQVCVYLVLLPIALPMMLPILWPFSVALTVSATRKKLENRYKESQKLVSSHQEKMFSSKDLKLYVKKYWMMTETRNPQFVIACSSVSSAYGVICGVLAFRAGFSFRSILVFDEHEESDYKWSLKIIGIVQSVGVVIGSIAPILRCFTSVGHYSLSKKLSKNYLNVFRVEKHWIQRLQQWKRNHIHSHIPGRHLKIVFHYVKNTFLNIFIALHIAVLVMCKLICLVPITFLILLSCFWYVFKSLLKRLKKTANMCNSSNVNSEIDEYTIYVVQIEEDVKLSKRILRNTLQSITKLLNAQKEPHDLMMLLKKSKDFNGVVEFHNDKVQPLYLEETHNCWSLVVVTMAAIAISLPNIANDRFKGFLAGMKEGLQIVRHIEEHLDADGESVNARKAARRVWKEVEVYRKWLQIDLQKKAHKGKTSEDILKCLGDEAEEIMKLFKSNKKSSIDHSPYEFILASSMYRISRSILLQFNIQETSMKNDEQLFEWISTVIADILLACFTNLPRVIKAKCHHDAIEKRGASIRVAAQLIGKSQKILKILKARKLPNMDQNSMAFVDKWRAILKTRIDEDGQIITGGICSHENQPSSSINNGSIIVPIL